MRQIYGGAPKLDCYPTADDWRYGSCTSDAQSLTYTGMK